MINFKNKKQDICDLKEFLSIPSISIQMRYKNDSARAAKWLVDYFKKIDFNAELIKTPANPLVFAEKYKISGAPTVLIYSHYDVQPADPVKNWRTLPFEPAIRNGNIFARGASDSKGQLLAYIKGVENLFRDENKFPLNIKFIIEGDEESEKSTLKKIFKKYPQNFFSDAIIIAAGSFVDLGKPSICYGARGLLALELEVCGPKINLHSGSFGGTVANPAEILSQIISRLKDKNGKICIPEFYKNVFKISRKERSLISQLPYKKNDFLKLSGAPKLFGELKFSPIERVSARPSLDVSSIFSGYDGEGYKPIIPAKAFAKLSFRLAPGQKSEQIFSQFKKFIKKLAPSSIKIKIKRLDCAEPSLMDRNSIVATAAKDALKDVFGHKVLWYRDGGSVPLIYDFQKINDNIVMIGFGLPDDNLHAPNEKLNLNQFFKGIEFVKVFLKKYAEKSILHNKRGGKIL